MIVTWSCSARSRRLNNERALKTWRYFYNKCFFSVSLIREPTSGQSSWQRSSWHSSQPSIRCYPAAFYSGAGDTWAATFCLGSSGTRRNVWPSTITTCTPCWNAKLAKLLKSSTTTEGDTEQDPSESTLTTIFFQALTACRDRRSRDMFNSLNGLTTNRSESLNNLLKLVNERKEMPPDAVVFSLTRLQFYYVNEFLRNFGKLKNQQSRLIKTCSLFLRGREKPRPKCLTNLRQKKRGPKRLGREKGDKRPLQPRVFEVSAISVIIRTHLLRIKFVPQKLLQIVLVL